MRVRELAAAVVGEGARGSAAGRRASRLSQMRVDDTDALLLQRGLDRLIRRARIGRSPAQTHRRFVVVQTDGLSAEVLDRALPPRGRMPFLPAASWRVTALPPPA